MISIDKKIEVCSELGLLILKQIETGELDQLFSRALAENPWFTRPSITKSLDAISRHYLNKEALEEWVDYYSIGNSSNTKEVGLVLAGNIPAVGFQDLLSVFICNHKAQVKYSSKDNVIMPYLINMLSEIEPKSAHYFKKVERLKDFDAVIATGGNNTSRYFEYYFRDVPHIIRKSRSSVALLTGKESESEMMALGDDIFCYFGLGCRNVSKLYLPSNYNMEKLLEILHRFNEVNLHHKYRNNFDYNIALFLLNKEKFLNNGSVILKEDKQIASRIACINYELYEDLSGVVAQLQSRKEEIQCIVSSIKVEGIESFNFGKAQSPGLHNYADGIDTMQFLLTL